MKNFSRKFPDRLFIKAVAALFLVFPALAAISPCLAGEVSIHTAMTITASKEGLEAVVLVSNKGNAPARSLEALLKVFDAGIKGKLVLPSQIQGSDRESSPLSRLNLEGVRLLSKSNLLPPGAGVLFSFSAGIPSGSSGSFPALLLVEYEDQNSLPISAVSGAVFRTPGAPGALLEMSAEDASFEGSGQVEVAVKNPSSENKSLVLSLEAPNELECRNNDQRLNLPSQGEKQTEFNLKHVSSLNGSYAVFIFGEYDQDGVHYTAMTQALVKSSPAPHWFRSTRKFWIALDALLIVLFFAALLRGRKS